MLENFYNELMYYLQERLDTLTEKRNISDDEIQRLAYDSASSAIIGVIVEMRKMKLRMDKPST